MIITPLVWIFTAILIIASCSAGVFGTLLYIMNRRKVETVGTLIIDNTDPETTSYVLNVTDYSFEELYTRHDISHVVFDIKRR